MAAAAKSAKVLKYERFISERLQPDLRLLQEERDRVVGEIAEFEALKQAIKVHSF